ncbi:MAG: hypothetical protein KDE56_00030 [Anaerolineales bacterium]|nr:hypothetical protein [Anaerolineales bacterium]
MDKVPNYLVLVAIVLLLAVGAYMFWTTLPNSAITAVSPEPIATPTSDNSLDHAIHNLTYTPFGGGEPVTLTDGLADNIGLESYVLGDLNGDGVDDAAFIVTQTNGGTALPEVGVALNAGDGTLVHVGNEFLFPDAQATVSIVGLQVVVQAKTADNDLPSITYIVADGRLVQLEMLVAEAESDAQYQQYLSSEWEAGQPTPTDSILSRDTLSNMVYQVEQTQDGSARLGVGTYREAPRTVVRLLSPHAYGDLTGDGVAEAVVVLGTNTGGSGFFMNLIVVAAVAGQPQQLASTYLGDGVQIDSIAVEDGIIWLVYDGTAYRLMLVGEALQPVENE